MWLFLIISVRFGISGGSDQYRRRGSFKPRCDSHCLNNKMIVPPFSICEPDTNLWDASDRGQQVHGLSPAQWCRTNCKPPPFAYRKQKYCDYLPDSPDSYDSEAESSYSTDSSSGFDDYSGRSENSQSQSYQSSQPDYSENDYGRNTKYYSTTKYWT